MINNQNIELEAVIDLAEWTKKINQLAKYYQIKNDINKKEYLYSLKTEALLLLIKSNYSEIEYYKPLNSGRVIVDKLCYKHNIKYNSEHQYNKLTKDEFIKRYKIKSCKKCKKHIDKNYYTLYHIKVEEKKLNIFYSFHLPYVDGKKCLGNYTNYPKAINHTTNNNCIFKFGRPTPENEVKSFTYEKSLKGFNKAYYNLQNILNKRCNYA